MKNLFFVIMLACLTAKAQTITEGSIDIKGKAGNEAGFIGKIDDDYLFFSAVPINPFGNNFYTYDPPTLYLLDKNLKQKLSIDLKKELKNLNLKDAIYENVSIFNNKIYLIIRSDKKSNHIIYELNKNSLNVNLSKKIPIPFVYKDENSVVFTSISADKSKFAITITNKDPESLEDPVKYSNASFGYTIVYTTDMKVFVENSFKISSTVSLNEILVYNQQVANNGTVCLLYRYLSGYQKDYAGKHPVYNTNAYLIDSQSAGKKINMKLPSDVYIPSSAKINVNDNNAVISGMPSIYDKQVYKVFGYFNQTMDNKGNVLGLNILPFQKFLGDNLQLKNKDGIEYEDTYLLEDGSFYMISHIFEGDRYSNMIQSNDKHKGKYIIISYFDKDGKTIWTKSINRVEIGYFTRINCLYRKSNKTLYIFYDSRDYKSKGIYYSTIDQKGNITESKKVTDNNQYILSNLIPMENEIMLFDKEKNYIDCASIKF